MPSYSKCHSEEFLNWQSQYSVWHSLLCTSLLMWVTHAPSSPNMKDSRWQYWSDIEWSPTALSLSPIAKQVSITMNPSEFITAELDVDCLDLIDVFCVFGEFSWSFSFMQIQVTQKSNSPSCHCIRIEKAPKPCSFFLFLLHSSLAFPWLHFSGITGRMEISSN